MRRAALALLVSGFVGCASTPVRIAVLDDVERVRAGADAKEGAGLAPEVFARAEQERRIALADRASGDDTGATLHAQRALAAYAHALVVARLSRAATELADAESEVARASAQEQAVEASRAQLDRTAQDLERQLHLARERLMPAVSAAATGDRESARLLAARSLEVDARLLCDAAALVTPDAGGLADASAEVSKLEARLDKSPHPAPIDDASRARARCLEVLTHARRAMGDDAGPSDALLSELAASGGWEPLRDERGVVVTLHDAFRGSDLVADAAGKLKDLGRVASAHPSFALQVVVHDAQAPAKADATDARRAEAASQALVAGGVAAARVKTELAGSRVPLVDPSDAKARDRNERLDVVFVASGK